MKSEVIKDMTWNEFIGRRELIGRDMENRYEGKISRGPITDIALVDGNMLVITTAWTAEGRSGSDKWERLDCSNRHCVFLDMCQQPFEVESGLIKIRLLRLLGHSVLVLPAGNNLKPEQVRGFIGA